MVAHVPANFAAAAMLSTSNNENRKTDNAPSLVGRLAAQMLLTAEDLYKQSFNPLTTGVAVYSIVGLTLVTSAITAVWCSVHEL